MKAILFALVPLVLVAVLAYWDTPRGGHLAGLGFMMLMCMAVVVESLLLLLIGIIMRIRMAPASPENANDEAYLAQKAKPKAIFLAAGIVLLVGGSLCFGGAAFF